MWTPKRASGLSSITSPTRRENVVVPTTGRQGLVKGGVGAEADFWSEGDSEVLISCVKRHFHDYGLPYAAGEICLYVLYAAIYVSRSPLRKHLHCAVRQISHKAAQSMPVGNPVGGIAKPDALNVPGKYYMFCRLLHIRISSFVIRGSCIVSRTMHHELRNNPATISDGVPY